MTIEELSAWEFNPPLTEGGEIKCPGCGKWSVHLAWVESDVFCDLCGEHTAVECPTCHLCIDHVWAPTLETRQPSH